MKKTLKLLKDLSTISGVSGDEKKVSRYILEQIKDFVNEVEYDNLGSLIALKKQNGPRVMIAASMDEIGLLVTSITKDGFVKFQVLGSWSSQIMLAQVWEISTKKGAVYGVTGAKPIQAMPFDKRNIKIPIESMYLDIGVASRQEAEALGVTPGNRVCPQTEFRVLGNEKYLLGKAWGNRVGSAVVIEVLKRLENHQNQVFGAFTVQKEIGLRGAKTSSYLVEPEIAISIDAGLADDVPSGSPNEQSLGKGPQIMLYDAGLIPNQSLRRLAIETAKENDIPFQESVGIASRTDAALMHVAHRGAASLAITIPTRYMHSHTSIIHYDDFENTVKLLVALLSKLDRLTVDSILE